MSKTRVRQHVNPMRSEFHKRTLDRLVLPARGEIEVELGCADAQFLFERAPAVPDTLLLGLEIREKMVKKVNRTAAETGVANVRAHYSHINVDLDPLLPDGRLARAFINFPDPWFKQRHRKRRLLDAELVEILHRKLRPSGELFFQSDVYDLALDALAVLEDAPGLFRNAGGPWSFVRDNPYGVRSLREARCEARHMRIWRMLYVRV